MNTERIQGSLATGNFEFSQHALRRVVERDIAKREIMEAARLLELIEDYPDDKYSPSCLLLGFTRSQRPLHLQVCYTGENTLKIVTIYEPDPDVWEDNRVRRPQ